MKRHKTKDETEAIRYMIHQRLRTNTEVEAFEDHPDEDTLCAFIEGRLEEAGSARIVSHLIACGSCRRTTAQFSRLDSQFNSEDASPLEDAGPSRLRLVLEGLAERVLPVSQEDVVFAYQNPPDQKTAVTETSDDESAVEPSSQVKETKSD